MKKALLILVTILLLTVLAILPTLGGGQIDDPYMLMVDGVLYLDTHTATQEPKADEIVGCTTSYTKKKPRKNGQHREIRSSLCRHGRRTGCSGWRNLVSVQTPRRSNLNLLI